jgi:phytoene dehydrogenase-like protein
VPNLLRLAAQAAPYFRPKPGQSTSDWLNRFTRNRQVHRLVDNVAGAFFAAAGGDLPAEVFLHYMTEGSAFKKIGYAPGGTVEVWNPLARYVEKAGGEVWLNSPAIRLIPGKDGLISGAEINRQGSKVAVGARVVVSNIGPLNTIRLAGDETFSSAYAEDVERSTDGAAIITVHFASQTPLAEWPGLALAGKSRRLTYAGNFSAPELRRIKRQGRWFLYSGASTPRPARGAFDLEAEKTLLMADLKDYFPGFDESMIVAIDVAAHEWPAQRAIAGYDLPVETPVANLWNVGDGVKAWADAGTAACVRTADKVVGQVVARIPVGR